MPFESSPKNTIWCRPKLHNQPTSALLCSVQLADTSISFWEQKPRSQEMKPVVYIESSVISYLTSRPNRDVVVAARQAITLDWWEYEKERFDLRISALVEDEIACGDPSAAKRRLVAVANIPSLSVSESAVFLAESLIDQRAIPVGSEDDALHIAIAATQGADYLLTWNFKHINNAETKKAIVKVIVSFGYVCPQICSPEELGGNSSD